MDNRRYLSLRTRLAIVLIILGASFAAGVTSLMFVNFRNELREALRNRLQNITTLAAMQQNGDTFQNVQAENDEFFSTIQKRNLQIKASEPDLRFVYTMRKNAEGQIYFVVDAGIPTDEGYSPFGTVYEEPGPALAANFDSLNEALLEEDFYTDEYGEFLSGYAPIFNSEGESVGVLGVDITANTIRQRETAYLFRLIGLYLLALPLLVFFGVLAADYLAKPIVGLRDMANKIKDGDFSTRITNIPNTRELAELAVDLNLTADNLDGLITDLEKRVADRTEGLTKRTEQLRTAAYIARQTADIQDLYSILETVVNLITDRFGFYHAGIFLMNESANEVVLQAASSEGGKRMLLRGHSLVVGSQGIVGYVASQKRTRIALDVGVDAVFFNNPDLPMTRSEVALPLLIRNRVLGVLDIQSDQPQAFHEEDLDVLQTLADQVAVAIDNARLLGEAQAALMQLETVSAIRTREAWAQRLEYQSRGYTYTPLGLRAETSSSEETKNRITTSITLRGQKIGSLSLAKSENEEWNKLDQNLITEVAYQIGLAVDNLRLLEDAQQRARQEQIIGELSTRFSQSLDIDTLLQTAARELGQLPDVDEVSVFIGEMPSTTTRQQTKRTTG